MHAMNGVLRMSKLIRASLLSLLLLTLSFGMMAVSEYQGCPNNELIFRTHQIALARVVSAELLDDEKCTVLYKFKTLEMLSGVDGVPYSG